jgi:hypothetical protein
VYCASACSIYTEFLADNPVSRLLLWVVARN